MLILIPSTLHTAICNE